MLDSLVENLDFDVAGRTLKWTWRAKGAATVVPEMSSADTLPHWAIDLLDGWNIDDIATKIAEADVRIAFPDRVGEDDSATCYSRALGRISATSAGTLPIPRSWRTSPSTGRSASRDGKPRSVHLRTHSSIRIAWGSRWLSMTGRHEFVPTGAHRNGPPSSLPRSWPASPTSCTTRISRSVAHRRNSACRRKHCAGQVRRSGSRSSSTYSTEASPATRRNCWPHWVRHNGLPPRDHGQEHGGVPAASPTQYSAARGWGL